MTYCKCYYCGRNFKLPFKARTEVPEPFLAVCPYCKKINICTQSDVVERNVHRFSCPVCGKKLFVEGELPKIVECPLCNSVLRVEPNNVEILKEGDKTRPFLIAVLVALLFGKKESKLMLALLVLGILRETEAEARQLASRLWI